MRGVKFREGYHDYTIVKGGLRIFPRLIASANPAVPVSVDPPIGEQARLIEAIAEGIASPR